MSTYTSHYPTLDSSHVKATSSFGAGFNIYDSFDSTESLTGSWASTWLSANYSTTNQKINVDLGSAYAIQRVYYENQHDSGGTTTIGIKNGILYGTNTVASFNDTVYANVGADLVQLWSGTFDAHTGSNVADPKYITFSNTTAYQYYIFRIADNYTQPNAMGVRRIELQTEDDDPSSSSSGSSSSSSSYIENWSSSSSSSSKSVSSSSSSSNRDWCSVYPTQDSTHVLATSKYDTNFWQYYATDPTKSLTGGWGGVSWAATSGVTTNQKFNIDLGAGHVIQRFMYSNGWSGVNWVDYGANHVELYGTNESTAFNNTTYADLTNLTLIWSGTWNKHVLADVPDLQYVSITNSTSYQYYIFRIADNFGNPGQAMLGFRRVELQELCNVSSSGSSSSSSTKSESSSSSSSSSKSVSSSSSSKSVSSSSTSSEACSNQYCGDFSDGDYDGQYTATGAYYNGEKVYNNGSRNVWWDLTRWVGSEVVGGEVVIQQTTPAPCPTGAYTKEAVFIGVMFDGVCENSSSSSSYIVNWSSSSSTPSSNSSSSTPSSQSLSSESTSSSQSVSSSSSSSYDFVLDGYTLLNINRSVKYWTQVYLRP